MRTFLDGALSYAVFLFCVTVHEFSHAFFADRFGDGTPRAAGRLTLNPLPHMDPFGTVLLPLLGIVSSGAVIGFASTPVNPDTMKPRRLGPALTVLAGPLSNAVLCLGAALGARSMAGVSEALASAGSGEGVYAFASGMRIALVRVALLSGMLAIFNLLPAGPLDGALFWRYTFPHSPVTAALNSGMVWIAVLAVFLFLLADPVFGAISSAVEFLAGRPA